MEEKSLEPQDGAEPEPQQREEEKQEEEIEKQEQENEKQAVETEKQEEGKEKQKEQDNVAPENEGKEGTENSETQKAEVLFSNEKVEVRLIPVPLEESVEEAHKLDEYVSYFHSDVFSTVL